MADFSARAPIELEKQGAYLHDRTNRPKAPPAGMEALVRQHLGLILGLAFALGFEVLAFQTRAGWSDHRDWVVPITTPLWALAGVALGHLVARRRISDLTPAFVFIALGLCLTLTNMYQATVTDGPQDSRDALTIGAAILYAAAILALVITLVVVELRDPTRAPQAQA